MELKQLECFVTIAEERHFGCAARRLVVSTATLSRRLNDLERVLGVRLFERDSRHVELTPAGAELLPVAQEAIRTVRDLGTLAQHLVQRRAGSLRALYSSGNGPLMSALVRRLRQEHPGVEVELEQRLSVEVAEAVASGEVPLGICRAFKPRGLAHLVLVREPNDTMLLPADHRLSSREVITLEDLAGETLLEPDRSVDWLLPDSRRWLEAGAAVTIRHARIKSEMELADRVAAGEGLSVTSAGCATRNARPDLVARPYVGPPSCPPREEVLLWRPRDRHPLVAAMVALARAHVAGEAAPRPGTALRHGRARAGAGAAVG